MTNNRSGRGKSRRNTATATPVQGKQHHKTIQAKKERELEQSRVGAGNRMLRAGTESKSGNMDNSDRKMRGDERKSRPFSDDERSNDRRNQEASNRSRSNAERSDLPVQKNDEAVIDIIGMNHDGEGVGRVEGFTLFVPGALPGEKVRVKVLKTKKQYGYAKLLDIAQSSPDRIAAPCAIYDQCGGCQIQHMSYEAQLSWKRQHVVDVLERIGKLSVATESSEHIAEVLADSADGSADHMSRVQGVVVHPTLGMSEPWRYRNKAQVPIGVTEGGLVGGFYARGSHRIVDMNTCLIQDERNDEVVARVKEIGRMLGISAYNEETGRGLLRHVVVKTAFRTGEMMLVLVTNGRDIPHADAWIGSIREHIPHVASICQNVNTKRTNVIFGDETRVLWGRDVIYDYIGNVQFAISPRSFYQVNPVQTEVLYSKTVEYAGLTGKETVIDAYCGIGTISLFLAQHADQVYGVEIVKEAIDDARSNALLNEMRNVKFEVGASEDVIPAWKEQGITADVIVVDPPRKGCDPRLLDTILEMKPERVVYVSCNPSTLARDLRILEDGGYKTVEVQPVDMFPHTVHVESVALLVRKD
ncbi:23S rRNA (uracil(1939)-C(5))-methyltransferase RlmD [Paenibacillus polymyxa]|uniref:23S rRNA (uracil(1939)-C(5))-methyltransferase RlmD n=1 Tax=Paenibacillus TaxID=44249 RepID=UPI00042EAFC4|nr:MULTISPECIES: 23S rRNA (uracil(1939)-C(5))-methyltransferase RlmD [Paenibacillus]AHM64539.1 RNA methyltransferase, trma family [Paenibacillus polymyxa SQR-21]KAF6653616.1 23S rRNA (uracil(1939)-C(5))-methyltransferase RlmD [Paenibacillus sp. EKM301P]RPE07144.1 23S rRNA (uracil(1939)-C(5))-methyltransferase RlmD [Paenibacillus polymyxa]UBS88097.1 23S rRNA (uracil(1939)-C(5))-methyltransferase RlmD [Paenibacillus polymyxa]WHX36689.1 23S rRNA (uracil(1939)-C(5))-methyltransferase RlmD [Paeniba